MKTSVEGVHPTRQRRRCLGSLGSKHRESGGVFLRGRQTRNTNTQAGEAGRPLASREWYPQTFGSKIKLGGTAPRTYAQGLLW
eukprot:134590-Pyramimonas_sp.AAC.2